MYSFLNKNGQLIAFAVGSVIAILFFILIATDGSTAELRPEIFDNLEPQQRAEKVASYTQFDFGMYATYFLFFATMLNIHIAFGLYQFVKLLMEDPKKAFQTLAMIIGLIVIFFIGMAMAPESSAEVKVAEAEFQVGPGSSNIIGGAINATIIMVVLTFGAFVVSEIRNLFK